MLTESMKLGKNISGMLAHSAYIKFEKYLPDCSVYSDDSRTCVNVSTADNSLDAYRHAYGSAFTQKYIASLFAKALGDYNERISINDTAAHIMDLYNNSVGRAIYNELYSKLVDDSSKLNATTMPNTYIPPPPPTLDEIGSALADALKDGKLITDLSDPRIEMILTRASEAAAAEDAVANALGNGASRISNEAVRKEAIGFLSDAAKTVRMEGGNDNPEDFTCPVKKEDSNCPDNPNDFPWIDFCAQDLHGGPCSTPPLPCDPIVIDLDGDGIRIAFACARGVFRYGRRRFCRTHRLGVA